MRQDESTPEWRCWKSRLWRSCSSLRATWFLLVSKRGQFRGPTALNKSPETNGRIAFRVWDQLDELDAEDLFLRQISHVAELPTVSQGRLREGFACALRERLQAKQRGDEVGERRAWKLFALIPLMLLHRPRGTGSLGRDELGRRVDAFNAGQWRQLIDEAVARCREPTRPHVSPEDEQVRRGKSAQARIQRGQVSRARHVLTGERWHRRRRRRSNCCKEGVLRFRSAPLLQRTPWH